MGTSPSFTKFNSNSLLRYGDLYDSVVAAQRKLPYPATMLHAFKPVLCLSFICCILSTRTFTIAGERCLPFADGLSGASGALGPQLPRRTS
jgi:hypothetical protein